MDRPGARSAIGGRAPRCGGRLATTGAPARPSERTAARPFTQLTSTTTAGGSLRERAAAAASAGASRPFTGSILESPPMELRVLHCPVNLAGTGLVERPSARRKGIDARLLVFRDQKWRPASTTSTSACAEGHRAPVLAQWSALACYRRPDIFHFYFGQTLVPKTFQFPILKATRRKCVMHSATTSAARP